MAGNCPKCGLKNQDGAVFCAKCTTKLGIGRQARILRDQERVPKIQGQAQCGTRAGPGKGATSDFRPSLSVTKTLETTPDGLGKGELFAGRFELIEELGAGGMGIVYRAYDKQVGEEIALKSSTPRSL